MYMPNSRGAGHCMHTRTAHLQGQSLARGSSSQSCLQPLGCSSEGSLGHQLADVLHDAAQLAAEVLHEALRLCCIAIAIWHSLAALPLPQPLPCTCACAEQPHSHATTLLAAKQISPCTVSLRMSALSKEERVRNGKRDVGLLPKLTTVILHADALSLICGGV